MLHVRPQIVVMGKSLGGAVGIYLAAHNSDKFAAAVIENTFTSIEEVAPKVGQLYVSDGHGRAHDAASWSTR